MNPVLLKPQSDRTSQVIVMGRPWQTLDAAAYQEAKPALAGLVMEQLADLRSRFDVVLCEGAGSPAEINLLDGDIVNLRVARDAGLPAIVVGDIDRGGVFAALYGTVALLPDDLRATVRGFVINKFRGDPALLGSGPAELARRTGVPTLGVLPWLAGLGLDAEDSLALGAGWPAADPARMRTTLDVAAVRFPRISNFTDLDALAVEPGGRGCGWWTARLGPGPSRPARPARHQVHRRRPGLAAPMRPGRGHRGPGRRTRRPHDRPRDLRRLPDARTRHPTTGSSRGPARIVAGLGLLAAETVFEPDKVVRWTSGPGPRACPSGATRSTTAAPGRRRPWIAPTDRTRRGRGRPSATTAGSPAPACTACSRATTSGPPSSRTWPGERAGTGLPAGCRSPPPAQARFDRLAAALEEHLDLAPERLIARAGLASVRPIPAGPDHRGGDRVILFLTNAASEILALRSLVEGLPDGFPRVRAALATGCGRGPTSTASTVVLVRLLGGRGAWAEPFDDLRRRCRAAGIPLLAFGGEAAPDAQLTAASTVPSATVAQAFEYLVHGGLANLEHLLRFVSDTVLHDRVRVRPPRRGAGHGRLLPQPTASTAPGPTGRHGGGPLLPGPPGRRQHPLRRRPLRRPRGQGRQASRRCGATACGPDGDGRVEALDPAAPASIPTPSSPPSWCRDPQPTTVWPGMPRALGSLASRSCRPSPPPPPERSGRPRAGGLFPLDVAMRVAIPEFDGRIIAVPFSFNEEVDDGDTLGAPVSAYRTVPDRVDRVAGLAVRLARLRSTPPADAAGGHRAVRLPDQAQPDRQRRRPRHAGVGPGPPAAPWPAAGYRVDRIPADGDALMAELIDAFSYERRHPDRRPSWPRRPGRLAAAAYRAWWSSVDPDARGKVEAAWGEAPGTVYRDPASGDLVFAGLDLGGVLRRRAAAPRLRRATGRRSTTRRTCPRPTTTWASTGGSTRCGAPTPSSTPASTAPSNGCRARASASRPRCFPDVALGDLPLVYPFVVNDPGEGTQAKRRAHAAIVDHLLPPMTRADTYDDVARLEQLLDEHAQVAALDPSKLPAIRKKVWELLVAAELHRDLGRGRRPRRRRASTSSSTTSTGTSASSRTPRSAAACTCSARLPPATPASTCSWP